MMLTWSPTSPFVRKVWACTIYAGVVGQVENRRMSTLDPALPGMNPLAKIPTMLLDDGQILIDSRTICEYLDSLHSRPRLFPDEPSARWRALSDQALADGISESAVLLYVEGTRPLSRQWRGQVEKQLGKITRTLGHFDKNVETLAERIDIGTMSIACAIGYAGLRIASYEVDWRFQYPRLEAWYNDFVRHEFMVRTLPVPPPNPIPADE